ncbi:Putative Virulent strain associated lipoprotein [endosymbiont DhMRE of Dentiscutata heterogama]|uniref:hypothetical protein n=1 Tax=endosymbiont DhMRE of Dentiscutata heterogama TaxID=1609546 RepID=UPI000629D376|nr:hypothetical protein [endosymbiont DhMRE of Dentiscutata heterogama]CFW92954.1 Putative Virulent strain associated lipoprotein [endosymbiont DhMRE of Dentiscutata heterogama]
MNQPFDIEEWLESKKKGFSGKIPRTDLIAKIKELAAEAEQLKKSQAQLTTQNKELENNLTNRDQIIQEKDKAITEIKQELTTKLAEQEKILQSKEEELKNLQQRPDITDDKYQELLNNQEKHRLEELRPDNLPEDWEKELAEKDKLIAKIEEMERQLKGVYTTYPIILEEEKPENVKRYIEELEKRPTQEKLQQVIQQERDKYKDYDNLKVDLEKQKENYLEIKRKYDELQNKSDKTKENGITETEYQKLNQQLQDEREKNRVLEEKNQVLSETKFTDLPPIVEEKLIKKISELLTEPINLLRIEIAELLKKPAISQPNKSLAELPVDYEVTKTEKEELLKILETLKLKILESEEKF